MSDPGGGDKMRRVHHKFIASPNRHIPDLVRELSEMAELKFLSPEQLLKLAQDMNNLPWWCEADYDEMPSPHHPGEVEIFMVPGTLKYIAPVTPEEMKEYIRARFQ